MIRLLLLVSVFYCGGLEPARASDQLSSEGIAALVDELELSSAQREQVNKLLARYVRKAAALKRAGDTLREDMRQQPLADISRTTIAAMSQRAGSVAARHTGVVLQTQLDFYRLLTPTQQAEYSRLREAGR